MGFEDPEWDSFVESQPMGHHEQTAMWGELKSAYGWKPLRLILKDQDKILAGVQLLLRRIGFMGSVGYVCKGPVVKDNTDELGKYVVKALHTFAKRSRVFYLAVELPYDGHYFIPLFDQLQYGAIPDGFPPSRLVRATLIADLSQSKDELLSQMRRSTRGNIQRGRRRGLLITIGADDEWPFFRPLMLKICARRGTGPTPPQTDFFDRLAQIFGEKKRALLFLAKFNKEIVAAAVVFPFGKTVRQWKVGWSGHHSKLYPNEGINWGVMNWAKENGFAFYENVGLDFENAKKISMGHKLSDSEWDRTTFFKIGFGGKVTILPEPRAYFFNPILRGAIKVGATKLLDRLQWQRPSFARLDATQNRRAGGRMTC